MEAYCVKCNRDKPKGTWKKTVLKNPLVKSIKTSRGTKYQARGVCESCGHLVTSMVKKPEQK